MALKKCTECGAQVSSKADACPQCGAKQPKPTSTFTLVVGGFFAVAVGIGVFGGSDEPAAAKAAPDPAKEREFQQVVASVKMLKAAMKNPASFELVDALMVQGPTLCITYRSTNSFNAVITEHYTVSTSVSSTGPDAWNKHCAGRQGTSYSHAKYAL